MKKNLGCKFNVLMENNLLNLQLLKETTFSLKSNFFL